MDKKKENSLFQKVVNLFLTLIPFYPNKEAKLSQKSETETSNLPKEKYTISQNWEAGNKVCQNQYTIETLLGEGGFGATYLAADKTGKKVVIKTPKIQKINNSMEEIVKFWKEFSSEAVKLQACCRHQHIVNLYEVTNEQNLPCLVMEYIEGQTLYDRVRESGSLPEEKALKYIQQIGNALQEIHQQNLLHRDVKPHNIMLKPDGDNVVLIDFGIAQRFSPDVTMAQIPGISPGFAPPEQYELKTRLGNYTDVYALAATLYFILTARPPFPASARIQNDIIIPKAKEINPSISDKTSEAIDKALSLEAKDRPQSIPEWFKLLFPNKENIISRSTKILKNSENLPAQKGIISNDFYPEGPIPTDSPFYIQRKNVDPDCYHTILQPGGLLRIKAPKQMGKTSLLNRILKYAADEKCPTVRLDFNGIDSDILGNRDRFICFFCAFIGNELGIEEEIEKRWKSFLGSNTNCTNYFEQYLLPQLDTPLVLGLDSVDRIFPYDDLMENFFPLLRTWHEKSKTKDIWKQFRLVLSHSTDIYVPLDINLSPFNAGVPVELMEFDLEQIGFLAQRYKLDWDDSQGQKLINKVGGHPFLIHLTLYQLSKKQSKLDQVLDQASKDSSIYKSHMKSQLNQLQKNPELLESFQKVVRSSIPIELDSMKIYKLHSLGLVKKKDHLVTPRCDLYREYFKTSITQLTRKLG